MIQIFHSSTILHKFVRATNYFQIANIAYIPEPDNFYTEYIIRYDMNKKYACNQIGINFV